MSAAGMLGVEAAALEGDGVGDDVEAGGAGGDGAGADVGGVGDGAAEAAGADGAEVGGGGDILEGGRSEIDGRGRVERHRGQIKISSASFRVRGI